MVNSRDIDALHPIVAAKASRYIKAAAEVGMELVIVSTLRDSETQAVLYAIGRTTPGPRWSAEEPLGIPVTYSAPGLSYHEYGLAFDAYPIFEGRLITEASNTDIRCWKWMQQICRDPRINLRMGLDIAPRWRKEGHRRVEFWHHQYSGGLTPEQLQAGERLPDVLF